MSQFIICRIKAQETLSHNIELKVATGSFYQPVIKSIFGEQICTDLYIPIFHKQDVDSLCTEAQKVMQQGKNFKSTKLFKFLNELQYDISDLVLWYGNDFGDLDHFCDFQEFLKELEISVLEPTCESYLHFKLS